MAGRRWTVAYAGVALCFLAATARYYDPSFGFTTFIAFPAATHGDELPAVQAVPHAHSDGGYDGQFYAQLAVEPLLRDPEIDGALDLSPYRGHRILFSWIAYAAGMGRPAWVLHTYAVLNVLVWLAFAWLLLRWMPPRDAKSFALWSGCLLSHGLLISVRYALPDALAALLVGLAMLAAERGRLVVASIVTGLAGLTRETCLLASAFLGGTLRRNRRSWIAAFGLFLICVLPLALWLDYLRSIYRSVTLAGGDHVTPPFEGLIWKVRSMAGAPALRDRWGDLVLTLSAVVAVVSQAIFIVWRIVRGDRSAWAFASGAFIVLLVTAHPVVWDGRPGAFTRVLLPMTIGANVLLARQPRASWMLIVTLNLSVIAGIAAFLFGQL
jgi:hypothetical protein